MTAPDVGAIAAEMLKKRLPGFETKIDSRSDAIAIHGALPISSRAAAETIFFPVMRSAYVDPVGRALMDVFETDDMRARREAREREEIEREIEPAVERIAEGIRRFGIGALGLEDVIAERERQARERGRLDGYQAGRQYGYAEGRRETLAELAEIREAIDDV